MTSVLTPPVQTTTRRRVDLHPDPIRPGEWVIRYAKKWLVLAVILAGVGGTLGALAGAERPLTYTAEARLTVGATSLAAFSVPGYVQATQELAANYARYVNSSQAGVTSLGTTTGGSGALTSVAASPIPDSNVLRIAVTGTSRSASVAAAQTLAEALVQDVAQPSTGIPALRSELDAASTTSARAQQDAEDALTALTVLQEAHPNPRTPGVLGRIERDKQALADARASYKVLQVEEAVAAAAYQDSFDDKAEDVALTIIRPAFVSADSESRAMQWGAAAGLVVGGAIGAALLLLVYRRRRTERW